MSGVVAAYAVSDYIDRLMAEPLRFIEIISYVLSHWTVYTFSEVAFYRASSPTMNLIYAGMTMSHSQQSADEVNDMKTYICSQFAHDKWYDVPIFPMLTKLEVRNTSARHYTSVRPWLKDTSDAVKKVPWAVASEETTGLIDGVRYDVTRATYLNGAALVCLVERATWGDLMFAVGAIGRDKGGGAAATEVVSDATAFIVRGGVMAISTHFVI